MVTPASTSGDEQIELDISGMTCAACANRIERKLNKLDGVTAAVNFATEKASVNAPEGFDRDRLLAQVANAGYSATVPVTPDADVAPEPAEPERDTGLRDLRQRLIGAVILGVPVIALSMIPPLQFTNWQWAALTLAAPVATWAAWPFHRSAAVSLRHGATSMDTLVSLGVLAAFGWSLYALFFGTAGMPGMTHHFEFTLSRTDGASNIYLEAAVGVTMFLLAGRYFEGRAKRTAGSALRALLELGAKDVSILRDGSETRVPVAQLQVGDEFVVRPGEKIATDGVVVAGTSAIDAALLTGESVPTEVGEGDAVTGGTVNAGGRITVRATRVGADTQLAQMGRLVEQAQTGKAPVQRLADRISGVVVPIVIVIAVATLIVWLAVGGSVTAAFTAAVAVLVIACPCALGLATPTALLVGTGRGAQLGILIKGPEILESTRTIDTIVLDKTGTVTTGMMRLVDAVATEEVTRSELLRLAGAVEAASEHPIARAIATGAEAAVGDLPDVGGFANDAGRGVQGILDGRTVRVGRASTAARPLSPELAAVRDRAESEGATVVVAEADDVVLGILVVADTVKSTSAEAIARLRGLGLTPVLLTGDNTSAARHIARQVGIERVHAEVLPRDKVDVIARLHSEGRVVAMVGDGVNDAPALAAADLGMAMGAGTDVAIEASDITLIRDDLRSAADAIRLSRRTLRTIKSNLFWAFAYNVAAIPIAALGLLNPMLAGAAMALSSVFVVANSLRIRGFRSTITES